MQRCGRQAITRASLSTLFANKTFFLKKITIENTPAPLRRSVVLEHITDTARIAIELLAHKAREIAVDTQHDQGKTRKNNTTHVVVTFVAQVS